MGVAKDHVLIGDNGQIFEFSNRSGHKTGHVNAGRVFVDGLGVGDVGNIVIRDRQQLAMEGVVIVVMTLAKARAMPWQVRILYPVGLSMSGIRKNSCVKPMKR